MSIGSSKRIAVGSALGGIAAIAIVLSMILGWSGAPRPWGFLLGFSNGVLAGLGATLAISGLLQRRSC